jgi:hypothetical protein
MARASEASGGIGSRMPRRRATIPATCSLGAAPYPVAAALISLALYSWTATPWAPQVTMAAPRAWPSLSAEEAFFARKTFSTAASVGRWRRISSVSSRWILKRRSGKDASPSRRMTPQATGVTAFPRTSTIPYPVRSDPGSIPRIRRVLCIRFFPQVDGSNDRSAGVQRRSAGHSCHGGHSWSRPGT